MGKWPTWKLNLKHQFLQKKITTLNFLIGMEDIPWETLRTELLLSKLQFPAPLNNYIMKIVQ